MDEKLRKQILQATARIRHEGSRKYHQRELEWRIAHPMAELAVISRGRDLAAFRAWVAYFDTRVGMRPIWLIQAIQDPRRSVTVPTRRPELFDLDYQAPLSFPSLPPWQEDKEEANRLIEKLTVKNEPGMLANVKVGRHTPWYETMWQRAHLPDTDPRMWKIEKGELWVTLAWFPKSVNIYQQQRKRVLTEAEQRAADETAARLIRSSDHSLILAAMKANPGLSEAEVRDLIDLREAEERLREAAEKGLAPSPQLVAVVARQNAERAARDAAGAAAKAAHASNRAEGSEGTDQ
jgi:hypothetical protein